MLIYEINQFEHHANHNVNIYELTLIFMQFLNMVVFRSTDTFTIPEDYGHLGYVKLDIDHTGSFPGWDFYKVGYSQSKPQTLGPAYKDFGYNEQLATTSLKIV